MWYQTVMQTPFLCIQTICLFSEWLLDEKNCLMVMLERKLCFLQLLKQKQLKTIPTNNWSHMLKRQGLWKSSSNLEKNVNYLAYMSECMIDICNTCTKTFGYQRHFFSHFCLQITFSLKFLWLSTASVRTRSNDGKHRNKSCDGKKCCF